MWKIPNYLKTILELMWVKQGQKKKNQLIKISYISIFINSQKLKLKLNII